MSVNENDSSTPARPDAPQLVESLEREEHSYSEILKSSAWIGGSSVLVVGIGIIRTKAMALLLGPAGFGLMGLYSSIIDLALAIASMGIGNSGVRQIAESVGSNDEERIARTVIVLRRTAVVLGILGAILVIMLARPLSTLTFGTDQHAGAVALLGFAVFFRAVAAGQEALIQGLRRIHDLALMGVLGALLGAVISIVLVYLMGEQGVAPSLVAGAAMLLLLSWRYSRKVKISWTASMRGGNAKRQRNAMRSLSYRSRPTTGRKAMVGARGFSNEWSNSPITSVRPSSFFSYPPYHSKYNTAERFRRILEQHWNGAKLVDAQTMLEWAKSMICNGIHPVLALSREVYEKDISLSKEAMLAAEAPLERYPQLPKWDTLIRPACMV